MNENMGSKVGYWKSFDDIDGLMHNCRCLLEDQEGNIWIGTTNGLCKYDGREFANFNGEDGLADSNIVCIYQDREGNIWIGTLENGVSRYDGSEFLNYTDKDGLAGNNVRAILQDRKNNIWIGTKDGLSRYDGEGFVNLTDKDGLLNNNVRCFYQDGKGNIWIGTRAGLNCYDGKEFANLTSEDGLIGVDISSISEDGDGNIWIGTENGLSRYDGKEYANFTHNDGLAGNNVKCMCQDREGNIWIGTLGNGVSYYDGNRFMNFNVEHGLAHKNIYDIIQDREGSIWTACQHGGVSRYDPYGVSYISGEPVGEVLMKDIDGNLWWGTKNILSQFDGRDIRRYPLEYKIYEITEDSKRQFWIGTDNGGALRYNSIRDVKGQKPQNLTVNDGLASNNVIRIYEDIQNNIWIGTRKGLSKYDGTELTNFKTDDDIDAELASAIHQDSDGLLWFAGWTGGGINSYDGKNFRRYTKHDGLISNNVVCITEDDKNNLWIGTQDGLSCYDGEFFRNYTIEDGLLGSHVRGILQDSRGQMWMSTLGGGVSRFDGSNFQALTTEDGLPSNCITGVIENSDGSMVISTYRGICRYTPDYKTPPLIRIDEVDADGIYHEPEAIQVSEGVLSVRIKYHGISSKTKRIRYNYILEGYDKDWKATWDEEVRYDNLPMGQYTFKVIAINRDMVYSEKPAEVKLGVIDDPRDLVISELSEKVRERTRDLEEAKDYIDNVVRSMADTLIVVDQDGIIKTVNQTAVDLLGYEEDELIGSHLKLILPEMDSSERADINDIIGDEFIRNVEKIYHSKDGREIPVLFSGSTMCNGNSEIQGIVCVAQDITEYKKAKQELRSSEERLNILFEHAPDAYYLSDLKGIFVDSNKTAEEITGYKRDELIGKDFLGLKILSPEQMLKVIEILAKNALGRSTGPDEFSLTRKDGSQIMVEIRTFPVDINQRTLVLGIAHDITNRKRAEKALQHQYEIEKRMVKELEQKTEELSRSNEELNTFVFATAHDLKAHVVSLQGFSSILVNDYENYFDEKSRMYIERIHKNSEGMGVLIDDLLVLSRIGRMEEQERLTNISDVISEAASQLSVQLEERGTRLIVKDGMPTIWCNYTGIFQIFTNLISNANKFMGADNKTPTIEVGYGSQDGHHKFYVKDNGIGISKEYHEQIFHIFQRLSDIETDGTGLGLTIVKKRIERLGGKIWVDSAVGMGTSVYFTIPKARQ